MADAPRPRQPVRRFGVLAEYSKRRALRAGRPLDEATAYGLWRFRYCLRYLPRAGRWVIRRLHREHQGVSYL